MGKINIIWCDDKIDSLWNEDTKILFDRYDCNLFKTAKKANELLEKLEKNKDFIDAVIIDFNIDEKSDIPDKETASGFRKIHEQMDRFTKDKPFYLFSGRDQNFIKDKYKKYDLDINEDYFFKKIENVEQQHIRYFQSSELETLLKILVQEVSYKSTQEYIIRKEFSEGFNAINFFQLDGKAFLDILLEDESVDSYDLYKTINPLRIQIEDMKSFMQLAEVLPSPCLDLNKLPKILKGKSVKGIDFNNKKIDKKDVLHDTLYYTFTYFIDIIQDGSHKKQELEYKVIDYIIEKGDIYFVKSLAIIGLDFIKWCKLYYNKYKDIKPYPQSSFEADIKNEFTKDGKKIYVVEDESEQKYSIQDNHNCNCTVGDRIKIYSWEKDTQFGNKYFVPYYSWKKIDEK